VNKKETQMTDILKLGKEKYGVLSVKAEFEAEGTRLDELLRLVDIARSAGLPLTVKIGGCEAIRDLYEAKQIGVGYIVAPMVETSYALSKYVAAKNLVFEKESRDSIQFLFNIETETGVKNLDTILESASMEEGVQGVVFGRVDYSGSKGLSRENINSNLITETVQSVANSCKQRNLDLVVGGGVSIESIDALRSIQEVKLTRFETRKVVFAGESIKLQNIREGLLNAVHFEMLWLLNKRDYYAGITKEDDKRIDMLEGRWKLLNS